ncbi:MAG: hypothetical protein ACTSRG_27375 [Candidatus Helarchaeota archaeon]
MVDDWLIKKIFVFKAFIKFLTTDRCWTSRTLYAATLCMGHREGTLEMLSY